MRLEGPLRRGFSLPARLPKRKKYRVQEQQPLPLPIFHCASSFGPVLVAGLFFRARLRSHGRMDPDLENVIRQALADAKDAGKDYLTQTEEAVRLVRQARPDMTVSDALAAVNLVRQS